MNTRIMTIGSLILLTACNAPETTPSTPTTTSTSSPSSTVVESHTQTASIKTSKASMLTKQGGGTIIQSDLATGSATVGDTSSEAKRVVITFSLAMFVGKSVSSAKVRLYFDSRSSSTIITSLGTLSLYQIAPKASFVTSDYSATETFLKEVIASNVELAALVNKQFIELDVTEPVRTAIAGSDAYFTIKLRFANEVVGGNSSVNFYGYYTSTELGAYIPSMEVIYE